MHGKAPFDETTGSIVNQEFVTLMLLDAEMRGEKGVPAKIVLPFLSNAGFSSHIVIAVPVFHAAKCSVRYYAFDVLQNTLQGNDRTAFADRCLRSAKTIEEGKITSYKTQFDHWYTKHSLLVMHNDPEKFLLLPRGPPRVLAALLEIMAEQLIVDDVSNFYVATFSFAASLFMKIEGMLTLFPARKYWKDTAREYKKKCSLYLHSWLHAKSYLESDDATPFGHVSEHDQDFFLGQVKKNSDRVNHTNADVENLYSYLKLSYELDEFLGNSQPGETRFYERDIDRKAIVVYPCALKHEALNATLVKFKDDAKNAKYKNNIVEHQRALWIVRANDAEEVMKIQSDQGVETMLAAKEDKFLKMCICNTETCKEYAELVAWEK